MTTKIGTENGDYWVYHVATVSHSGSAETPWHFQPADYDGDVYSLGYSTIAECRDAATDDAAEIEAERESDIWKDNDRIMYDETGGEERLLDELVRQYTE